MSETANTEASRAPVTEPAGETAAQRAVRIRNAEEAAGLVGVIDQIDAARKRIQAAELMFDAEQGTPEGDDSTAVGILLDGVTEYLDRSIESLVKRFTPELDRPPVDQTAERADTRAASADDRADYPPILKRDAMIRLLTAGRDRAEAARCIFASREHSPNDVCKERQENDEAETYREVEVAVELLDRGLEQLQAWNEEETKREQQAGFHG